MLRRDSKRKVSKYIKLLCLLGLLRVNSLQLCPAAALEVAPLSVRAPADPYQPLLLFNSLHIHDTSTYSSCKMQMPLSFSSQRKAVFTSEIFVLFLYCHPTAGHVDFILRMNQFFFIILIISSDNHSKDVRWISHHVLFQKSWLLRKASSPNIKKVTILPLTAILEFESFVIDVNSFSPAQFITRTT